MQITLRPIVNWPGPGTAKRKKAQFKVDYTRALRDLTFELRQLKADKVVLQLAITERDIRRDDGWLRADAKVKHPGVVLAFEGKFGPVSFPCDTYTEWQDNIRAIGLALESLRAVDRYGVTRRGEQYTGWKQLPGALITPPAMTVQQAAALLSHYSQFNERLIVDDNDAFNDAYREAVKKLHPDANKGTERPEWHRLQEAAAVLRAHHG